MHSVSTPKINQLSKLTQEKKMGGMTLSDPAVKEPELIRLIKYSARAPGEAPALRETRLLAAAGPRNASQGYGSTRKLSTWGPVPFPHLFTGHPLLPLMHPALPMTRA